MNGADEVAGSGQRQFADYKTGLQYDPGRFFRWYAHELRAGFTKATVSDRRVTLEERGLASSSIIIRMSAIRKLAVEATDKNTAVV